MLSQRQLLALLDHAFHLLLVMPQRLQARRQVCGVRAWSMLMQPSKERSSACLELSHLCTSQVTALCMFSRQAATGRLSKLQHLISGLLGKGGLGFMQAGIYLFSKLLQVVPQP